MISDFWPLTSALRFSVSSFRSAFGIPQFSLLSRIQPSALSDSSRFAIRILNSAFRVPSQLPAPSSQLPAPSSQLLPSTFAIEPKAQFVGRARDHIPGPLALLARLPMHLIDRLIQ